MTDRFGVRRRLEVAKRRLRAYEGHLKQLEGRVSVIRGQAAHATGRARLHLQRAERQLRATIDATLKGLEGVTKTLEPRVQRAIARSDALQRSLRAGVKAGIARYRRPRSK
ncbi:MAG: hypothetical protein ACREJG_05890 [Candidatus Rokuibacteriota bacterium]